MEGARKEGNRGFRYWNTSLALLSRWLSARRPTNRPAKRDRRCRPIPCSPIGGGGVPRHVLLSPGILTDSNREIRVIYTRPLESRLPGHYRDREAAPSQRSARGILPETRRRSAGQYSLSLQSNCVRIIAADPSLSAAIDESPADRWRVEFRGTDSRPLSPTRLRRGMLSIEKTPLVFETATTLHFEPIKGD